MNTLTDFWGAKETTLMSTVRVPYWLDHEDRSMLAQAIVDLLASASPFPATKALLEAVLTELGVVEARNQMWPHKTDIMRRATGYDEGMLPIRMSDDELHAVLAVPYLSEPVRRQLSP